MVLTINKLIFKKSSKQTQFIKSPLNTQVSSGARAIWDSRRETPVDSRAAGYFREFQRARTVTARQMALGGMLY